MKIDPLRDRVHVLKDTPAARTAGGIEIPDVCKDPPMTGTVLAIGPGRVSEYGVRIPMEVKVGEKVLFKKYDGINARIDGKEVYIVPEREVLAHWNESDSQASSD